MTTKLDIVANRKAQKWSRRELAMRAAWEFLSVPLFAWSPRLFWGWRRSFLRMFGAKIGDHVHIFPSVKIAIPWTLSIGQHSAVGDGVILYSLGPICIGERVTISQYAHLCAGTHDYSDPTMPLMKTPIVVGDEAWICADAFIAPGVTVADRAIVAARAVVTSDVPFDTIVAGNPARKIKDRPTLS